MLMLLLLLFHKKKVISIDIIWMRKDFSHFVINSMHKSSNIEEFFLFIFVLKNEKQKQNHVRSKKMPTLRLASNYFYIIQCHWMYIMQILQWKSNHDLVSGRFFSVFASFCAVILIKTWNRWKNHCKYAYLYAKNNYF